MAEDVRYRRILQAICGKPWAILPEKLEVIVELVRFRAEGGRLTREEIDERIEQARPGNGRPNYAVAAGSGGNIAVIPMFGVIMPRAGLFSDISGGVALDRFQQTFQQALDDPTIGALLLDIDSPGGSVDLVTETAAVIRAARGKGKPIVAIADTMAASAAYCLAAQADEIVVTPSGEVGSIGCIAIHQDYSRMLDAAGITTTMIAFGEHKADGYPYAPLSDDAEQALQESVDAFGLMFEADVAKGRGISQQTVHDTFGQGLMFPAQKAVKVGLADKVDTFQNTVSRLAHAPSRARVGGGASAAALPLAPESSYPAVVDERWNGLGELTELQASLEVVAGEIAEISASRGSLRQADTTTPGKD